MRPMRIGIDIAQQHLPWVEIESRARFADEAGFEGLWLFDHFKAMYADPDGPCFEAWTSLAALAAATERIRLGILVTGVTYRHPSVLASQAITVDHVSGGRLDFSLGAAWFEPEHRAFGIPFPPVGERVDRFEEALTVYKALLTTDAADVDGDHYRLEAATMRPRPVQTPWPPIWIGASGEARMLPLAARHADVWHCFGDPATLAHKWEVVRRSCDEIGRDPAEIRRGTNVSLDGDNDDVRRSLDALAGIGITDVIASWPGSGQGRVEEFAALIDEYREA